MLTKSQIKDLKNRLKKPYFKSVVERSGMSERSVSNFFEGKKYHLEVHQAAIELAEEFDQEKKELYDRQKALSHAK